MNIKAIVVIFIRIYQIIISPLFPPCCRFIPSCSHYAVEAVCTHGPLAGIWLTVKRLLRCHPFGGYGIDPVPEVIGKKSLKF